MQRQNNPFFSIIIPVYQAEAYLNECIDSVLHQSFQDYEIWLIDDGCSDQSPSICDVYVQQDHRIHVLHKQNAGVSAARNDGIKQAKGEYILFLDSDDALMKEALMQLVQRIQENEQVDVITGMMDSEIVVKHTLRNNQKMSIKDFWLCELNAQTMSNAACLYIYRRAFLKANQLLFPIGFHHEDEYFTPMALLKAESILPTDVCYYHYRVNEASITNNQKNFDKNYKDLCFILKQLEQEYNQIKDEILKAKLLESLLEKYLYIFVKAKGYRSQLSHIQMDDFVKNKALTKRNKIKVLLYQINKRLYCTLASR